MTELAVAVTKVVTTGSTTDLIGILSLGALALIVFTIVYLKKGEISAVFGRVFALIVVAVLGVALGLSNISGADQTAGFTLLGTVAGYLAGVKTQLTAAKRPRTGADTRAEVKTDPAGDGGDQGDTITYF
jgi:hypothetical protein